MHRSAVAVLLFVVTIALAGCSRPVVGEAVGLSSAQIPASQRPPQQNLTQSPTLPSPAPPSSTLQSPTLPSPTLPSPTLPSPTADPASPSAEKWKLPEPTPDRPKDAFGDLIAKPGESNAVMFTDQGRPDGELVFVVTKITVNPTCTATAPTPKRGHFLRLDMEIEPHAMSESARSRWGGSFGATGWVVFNSAGSAQPGTDTEQARNCLPSDQDLPTVDAQLLARNALIKGAVVLDVTSSTGTALLSVGTASSGWVFSYR